MSATSGQRGTTLVELSVTLLIVAILLALVSVAPLTRPAQVDPLGRQRRESIRDGRRVVFHDSTMERVLLLPDGRAVGMGRDPLTGEADNEGQ